MDVSDQAGGLVETARCEKIGRRWESFDVFKNPDGTVVSVADACQICGPVGFYIGDQGITCKMCASPLNAASMGQRGGCNPIPLKSSVEGVHVVIQAADLRELAPVFER